MVRPTPFSLLRQSHPVYFDMAFSGLNGNQGASPFDVANT